MELRIPVGRDEVWAEHLAGDGVPIVLLHPDSSVWDSVVPLLNGRRVLRYDVRGYGRSAAPTGEFSLLEDLIAVLDQLALDQVLVVGCAIGGGTALNLALAHPDRVHGLVLLAPEVTGFPWPLEFDAETAVPEEAYLKPDPPVYDRLNEVRAPSLVMVGDKDRPILAAVAGATAARIPGCEFSWLPNTSTLGHPRPVADTILRMADR